MGAEARFSQTIAKAIKPHQWRTVLAFRLETSHTMPGIPDWLFLFNGGRYLFLELKAANGRLTPAQKIVLPVMERFNIPVKLLTKKKNSIIMTSVNKEDGQAFASVDELVENIIKEYSNV